MVVLGLGAAGSLAVVVAPPDARSLVALPLFVVALIVVWRQTRRLPSKARQAFTYFCAAGTVSFLGAITRFAHGRITGAADPLPSPADALFVIGYLLFILGGVRFYRYRVRERDPDGWLDSFILAAAVGFMVWDVLLIPYLRDGSIIPSERAMNAVYSVLTLTLLAITVRIVSSPGRRLPSYYLFGAAVSCFFVTDLLSTLQYAWDWEGDFGLMMTLPVYALFGAAIYHPSAGELTEPLEDVEPQISIQRIAGLAGALLVPPILLVHQVALSQTSQFAPIIIASSFVLAVLVTYRLYRLVIDREQMTVHAQRLQSISEDLLAATSLQEIYDLTIDAALDVDTKTIDGASMWVGEGDERERVASHGQIPRDWSTVRHLDTRLHATTERRIAWSAGIHLIRLDTDDAATLLVKTSDDLDRFQRRYLRTLAKETSLALRAFIAREQLAEDRGRRHLDALVQNSGDLVIVAASPTSPFDYVSPAARGLLDHAPPPARADRVVDLVHPDERAAFLANCAALGAGEHTPSRDMRLGHDESWVWFDVVVTNLLDDPDVGGLVVNGRDATERLEAQRSLYESEARFRALVQNSADIVAVVDGNCIRYASPSVERVLGYLPDEVLGRDVTSLVHDDDHQLLVRALNDLTPEDVAALEVRIRTSSGRFLTMEVLMTDLREEPAVRGVVVNARDITVPRELESKLRQAAYFDALTGLPNRAYLEEKIPAAIRATRGEPFSAAVLILDLDDFKDVNDGFGREAGDAVLCTVARRVEEQTRGRDICVRIGGDEFAVLITECYGDFELEELGNRLIKALSAPISVGEQTVTLTASVGIARSLSARTDDSDLLRDADAAVYLAKEQGKSRAELFKESRRREAAERVELTNDMRLGLERNEFFLAYQPIVDLSTGCVTGLEALARWNHPSRGLVMPGVFIPLAEQNGLILQLGRYVLQSACNQLRQWASSEGLLASVSLSVNLSTQQMRDPSLVPYVRQLIEGCNLDAARLTLEVTESLLADDPDAMLERLINLKELGVALAIDDFGTGYSSLSYLQRYPFDVLKIDRSFVAELNDPNSEAADAVVKTIVDLAHHLGATTVAEGIEDADTSVVLARLGCQRGQGYFFGRPAGVDALPDVIKRLDEAASAAAIADTGTADASSLSSGVHEPTAS